MKKLTSILGICVAIITIFGGFIAVDAHYAEKTEVQLISQRLDQKILQDRLHNVQDRIWRLEDRYQTIENMPDLVREEYRKLLLEKEQILNELQNMKLSS